ncbi:GNAT family N-acetyltransferase [Paremcibacter congregatus]|uniref:GNAT family N-acetyltransferase n=1 Tax=Paremcibacter congregatus TaxID=2043170 RepID=A0A2G4YRK0_9PROT|nr:GNAT family N-acetyltransferase [Paremcibacter congregatus]PHZ84907.1 GNAT family N-acetyltransferase [Paremcibacter congregatus]QDE26119.1 GNAT family N-acetyltransferase [Paremcibacter congregatus]|tara:strand:- start:37 stop:504 length:468 start_codon:yes stop_codon:yes gene_type:complete
MIEIVEMRDIKFAQWADLYQSYAEFYKLSLTPQQLQTAWEWLSGHDTELRGLAALVDGEPKAIAHYRRFLRPLAGEVGIFLDDIYVCPSVRRHGVGKILLERLENIAKAQGCTVIRWMTAGDNRGAQSFYDTFGKQTDWITYDHNMSDEDDVRRK